MNKKIKIIIGILALFLITLIIVNIFKNDSKDIKESKTDDEDYINIIQEVQYNEETGEYYIIDEANGVVYSAPSEEELYPPKELEENGFPSSSHPQKTRYRFLDASYKGLKE